MREKLIMRLTKIELLPAKYHLLIADRMTYFGAYGIIVNYMTLYITNFFCENTLHYINCTHSFAGVC